MLVVQPPEHLPNNTKMLARSRAVTPAVASAIRTLAAGNGRIVERDGLTIATLGTAIELKFPNGARCTPSYALEILDEIQRNSPDRTVSPIVLGALPFDLGIASSLFIAEITLVARGGQKPVVIFVGDDETVNTLERREFEIEARQNQEATGERPPDHFTLHATVPHGAFEEKVAAATLAISDDQLQKVVLAREVVITANRPFRQNELFERLRTLHPSCLSFGLDGFIGATPELLIRRVGLQLESIPLAGTIARSGDPEEDARLAISLMNSTKDRREHQFVVDAIVEVLSKVATQAAAPSIPHIMELRNVVHLASNISALLTDSEIGSLDIAMMVHPSPAVCGTPRALALDYIRQHEGLSRDRYAGIVGYTDANGDGEWWIGIRSAIFDGPTARMFAGVGIVADSDPASELAETQLKLQAMLAVLVRP